MQTLHLYRYTQILLTLLKARNRIEILTENFPCRPNGRPEIL